MKADGSLKSLLQGVSQQPVRDRLPGQCTEQINMSADPVKGLTRRSGDDLVGTLGIGVNAAGWGNFQTQDGRQFLIKITATGPQIFDYNSNQYTVNISGSMNYWSTPGRWSLATMKSKTYLANEGVVVSMRDEEAVYPNIDTRPMGIIQVLGGNYGKKYIVRINGTEVANHLTPDGSVGSHAEEIGTTFIATELYDLLVLSLPTYAISRVEDVILLQAPIGSTQFNITASDDAGNINLKAMTTSVPDIADLSRWAPQGYVVRVAQETDPEEDLWLKFVSDVDGATLGSNFGNSGAWYETVAPGLSVGFTKSTMPRILTFDAGTLEFSCGEADWTDRTVGTEITNPEPSFVGYGISDLSVFQSRLVVLAGPNLIGSRSKRPENFWVGSASTITDSDPIDLTSQAAFASTLEFGVPHNKDLVVFSPKGQFVLFGRSAVTPSNAALVLTTSFEADLTARPVPCGRNVFFATKYGRFTGVREFFTEGGTDINDTRAITSHVNQYLIGNPAHMSATSNYDTLLVHTDANRKIVYPYQFIWSDNEKIQSAWSQWEFPSDIVYSFFDDEMIYLVQQVGEQYYLLRMSLDVYPQNGLSFHLHMSNRFDVFGVNKQFVLPYDWMFDRQLLVAQAADAPYPGLPVRILSVVYTPSENGYVVTLKDDMQGGDIVVGVSSKSRYKPTMPRLKDSDGVVITNSRLQINQFLITTEETGHIVGQKLTKWGNAYPVSFEGYVSNAAGSMVGFPSLNDYVVKMPFKERADRGELELSTDQYWPMTILDIEWEGTLNKRGKRVAQGDG